MAYLAIAMLAVGKWPTVEHAASIGPAQAIGTWASCSAPVRSAWSWRAPGSFAMAFSAQAAILLGYAAYRSGFSPPPLGDASAMLILAGHRARCGRSGESGPSPALRPSGPGHRAGLAAGLGAPITPRRLGAGRAAVRPVRRRHALRGNLRPDAMEEPGLCCGRALQLGPLGILGPRGWRLADSPHLYLVPVGLSTILFAEANRRELGRPQVNAIRGVGLALIYLALAFPIWQTASLGGLGDRAGRLAACGLRRHRSALQTFLWLGLAGFVLDVGYQLGRIGREHALAKWAIMLALGIGLVLFVAAE